MMARKRRRLVKTPEIKIEKPKREDYGIKLNKLKGWQDERDKMVMLREEARQEVAVARVRGFLDAMRMLRRLQSWWRMMTFKMEFKAFRNARLAIKRKFYTGWKQYWQAEHMFLYHRLGKPFDAWASETLNSKQLKIIVKEFFNLCVKRLKLAPQAVMAYFAPPGDDTIQISETDGMKIRRLILSKLFEGWKAEVRELRGQRFGRLRRFWPAQSDDPKGRYGSGGRAGVLSYLASVYCCSPCLQTRGTRSVQESTLASVDQVVVEDYSKPHSP